MVASCAFSSASGAIEAVFLFDRAFAHCISAVVRHDVLL